MTTPRPLDTGSMNFAELRRSGCCYVDKTMHLHEVLGPARGPLLLTRPRRFGKTLTQTTLRAFVELNYEHPGAPNDAAPLFEELAVSADRELCAAYQSQFPVIFITLKDVQCTTFSAACSELCGRVEELCREFAFLTAAPQLSSFQREDLTELLRLSRLSRQETRFTALLTSSLLLLAQCLYTVYGRPAYILIDEYDVPLLWAAHYSRPGDRSYYDGMLDLTSGMLGKVIKTSDPAVRRCIVTGCLRLAPPGRLSGINNLLELGMEEQCCAELMGFTAAEVERLLSDYGLQERGAEVAAWYDGYLCGRTRLYNPWSIMHYCHTALHSPEAPPRNYWVRTSSNDFRRYFINELSAESIEVLQRLLDGQSVSLRLREQLSYPDLDEREYDDRAFFTMLYYAGYLTRAEGGTDEDGCGRYVIPNCEVLDCFRDQIHDCYQRGAVRASPQLRQLVTALLQGDQGGVEEGLNWLYSHYLDMQAAAGRLRRRRGAGGGAHAELTAQEQPERERRRSERELGYQAITQGMLSAFAGEALEGLTMEQVLGSGRTDICFAGSDAAAGTLCLLEFKVAASDGSEALGRAAGQGLEQTRDNGCAAAALERNPRVQVIYSYGIGCRQKSCRVQVEMVRRGGS